jgi:hypothetical protein
VKSDANLMNPAQRLQDAPRCTAHSKRTGKPCKAPAVRGWAVCRFHGAGGGAPCDERHGNYRHGGRTKAAQKMRKLVNMLARIARDEIT